eukprot:766019-Hanusia_phi.AAC.1
MVWAFRRKHTPSGLFCALPYFTAHLHETSRATTGRVCAGKLLWGRWGDGIVLMGGWGGRTPVVLLWSNWWVVNWKLQPGHRVPVAI